VYAGAKRKFMVARVVSRTSFWIGIAAATAIPFVPFIYRWFYPPRSLAGEAKSLWDAISAVLDSLNSFSDGIAIFLWIVGLTALVAVASLVAIIAAWRAQESSRRKILCGLPILTAAAMWVVLVLTV
jgi:hypothetical protein